jgi:hypothetical protein
MLTQEPNTKGGGELINKAVYIINNTTTEWDCLCGLWSECPATDAEILGLIPGAVRFSEK